MNCSHSGNGGCIMSEQVTIIMPVYNPGKYLRPCLDSLLAQTMEDFRIIAIDDGSTDGSWDILREYAALDARVLPQKNPYNIGAARTRNIGIQLAQGEYVVILDADDYFEPDYLECLWTACKENDLDIAICDFYWRDESTASEFEYYPSCRFRGVIDQVFQYIDMKDYIFQLFISVPFIKMYKRDFLLSFSLQFQDISNSNDIYFGQISLIYAKRILHINKALVHYRYNTGCQISTNRYKNPECAFFAFLNIYKALVMNKLLDSVKRSFYVLVVTSVLGIADKMDSDTKKTFLENWNKNCFALVGMCNLKNEEFYADYIYEAWKYLAVGGAWSNTMDVIQMKQNAYASFFEEVRKRSCKVAHWGYGKLGKQFACQAVKYGVEIAEIYDRDSSKWGMYGGVPIKSFLDKSCNIDFVVMTNAIFEKDIKLQCKKIQSNIKIFDFDAYLNFGLSWDECVVL